MEDGGTLRRDRFHRKLNGCDMPLDRDMTADYVRFTHATRDDAARVHGITQTAYAEYRGVLDPPSGVIVSA